MITAAPTSEYPVTAHCRASTDVPASSLMAGSRMLTAEVFALTTSVERQVAASTPLVRPGPASTLGRAQPGTFTRTGRVRRPDDSHPDQVADPLLGPHDCRCE